MSLPLKAQTTLEYLTIITLVTVGILVMSPYVIRSINAYFKTGDDAVEDSFSEEFKQAPQTGVTLPGCDCPEWDECVPNSPGCRITKGCGTSSPCGRREEHWQRVCTPTGCEVDLIRFGINLPMFECRPNTTDAGFQWCCEDWFFNMECQGGLQDPDGAGGPLLGKCCSVNAIRAPGGRCPDGQVARKRFCGEANFPQYDCLQDPGCIFQCMGVLDEDADPCDPGWNRDLVSSMAIKHVDPGGCTGRKCQAECHPGYIAANNGANCLRCILGDTIQSNQFYGDTEGIWVGADCPSGYVMTGIWTTNVGKGGHNWWYPNCRRLRAGCFSGRSWDSSGSLFYEDTEGRWVGADCPSGYVMTGIWTTNVGKGGHNFWYIKCKELNPGSCLFGNTWTSPQFYEDTEGRWVGADSPFCYVTYGVWTTNLGKGGHNLWYIKSME